MNIALIITALQVQIPPHKDHQISTSSLSTYYESLSFVRGGTENASHSEKEVYCMC